MDTLFLIRLLVLAFLQGFIPEVSSEQSVTAINARTMAPKVDSTTREKRQRKIRHQHSKTHKANGKKNCCENGGICILGSFCHCQSGFYGRYCEFSVVEEGKSCGMLPHGYVGRDGCSFCKCTDGKFYCIENIFSDCGNNTTTAAPGSGRQTVPEGDRQTKTQIVKKEQENILMLSIKKATENSLNVESGSSILKPCILYLMALIAFLWLR